MAGFTFRWKRTGVLIAAALFLWLTSWTQLPVRMAAAQESAPPEQLVPQVLAVWPHDTDTFTEGLIYDNGVIYESGGRYGQSTLREVDLATGETLKRVNLAPEYFGEGIALVGNRLIQLTWREDTGFRYDRDTFALMGEFTYTGEGWGMCYDGTSLYTDDGGSDLTVRDPDTFAVQRLIPVTVDNQPITMINELECVGELIYSNVWQTNEILRIDKASGQVTAVVDAAGLLTPEEIAGLGSGGVLNGIAYVPERDTFLITGKLWPKLFEVSFVPAATPTSQAERTACVGA